MQMKKALTLCTVLALASLSLAACGGGGDDNESASTSTPAAPATTDTGGGGGGGGGSTLALAADPSALKFDKTALTAKAGKVTIDFDNPSAIGHDVEIEQEGGEEFGKTDVISQSKATLTVNLKPGSYVFYCSVDGHRQAGMEGKLTVN
jgi:plastocyanin